MPYKVSGQAITLPKSIQPAITLPKSIQPNNFSFYTDPVNHIKIEYPANWTKINSNNHVEFLPPLQNRSSFVYDKVSLNVISSPLSLDNLSSSFINHYSKYSGFHIGQSSPINFKGHSAKMVTFTNRFDHDMNEGIVIFTTISDNHYTMLNYQAHSKTYAFYLPTVQKMINSLEISPASVSLSSSPSASSKTHNATNISSFEDLIYGIKINFPFDWHYTNFHKRSVYDSTTDIVTFRSKLPTAFNLGIDNLGSSQVSLEYYTNVTVNALKQSNATITEAGPTTISGNTAYKIVFDDLGMRWMKVWTIIQDKAYVLTYISEPSKFSIYLPTVQKMIDSFKITSTDISIPSLLTSPSKIAFSTYGNASQGIKIDYPSIWLVKERSIPGKNICYLLNSKCSLNIIDFIGPKETFLDKVRESVSITNFFSKNSTLSDLAKIATERFQNFQDYQLLELKDIKHGNSSAIRAVYQYRDPSLGMVKAFQFITKSGDMAYLIRFTSEPSKFSIYLPTVQKMIDSFEISPLDIISYNNVKFYTYENATAGIKIDYPSTWTLKNTNLPTSMRHLTFGLDFVSPPDSNSDNFQEKLTLLFIPHFEDISLDDFLVDQIARLKNDPSNGNDMNITSFTVSGVPASMIIYSSNKGQFETVEVHAMKHIGFHNTIYNILFRGEASKFKSIYWPIVQKMVKSFKIIGFLNLSKSGVHIQYPFDWIKADGNSSGFLSVMGSTYNSSIYFFPPTSLSASTPAASFLMQVENLPSSNVSLHNYVDATVRELRKTSNIINSTQTMLGGNPAVKVFYTSSSEGIDYKAIETVTIKNNKAYYFSYSAPAAQYNTFLPTIQRMMESFRIIQDQSISK